MTTTKEELEKAVEEYVDFFFPEEQLIILTRNTCRRAFLAGAKHGIRIGFEAAREVYSADEGTNSYRYNIEDFLKEIE